MGLINKLLNLEKNITNKSISVNEADSMLRRTNELANIANKTTNREEFYNSVNEIKSILKELSKYEGKLPFAGSPSADLKTLERTEQKQLELLEQRIAEKERNENFYYKAQNRELDDFDEYTIEAGRFVIERDKASIGLIQRNFKIGFNRALRIMNKLEEIGVVGPEEGTAPRKILVTKEEYKRIVKYYNSDHLKDNCKTKSPDINRINLYNNKFDYMTGHDFEYFCADVLRKNRFSNVTVTQGSGDHGIDILAEKDDITYAIQCKCYSSDIGNSAVQQAHTGKSIYQKDIAVVLTNRYFTPQAIEEAKVLGVKLWDRDKLNEMTGNS